MRVAVLLPSTVYAQASIAGVVRDTSGAVLPGVTVEAASPVLIEKVRTTSSRRSGTVPTYRPAAWDVHGDVHAAGFNTVKRDGIILEGTFIATVNADLRVGALEETITVTGAAPVVDVQSATSSRCSTASNPGPPDLPALRLDGGTGSWIERSRSDGERRGVGAASSSALRQPRRPGKRPAPDAGRALDGVRRHGGAPSPPSTCRTWRCAQELTLVDVGRTRRGRDGGHGPQRRAPRGRQHRPRLVVHELREWRDAGEQSHRGLRRSVPSPNAIKKVWEVAARGRTHSSGIRMQRTIAFTIKTVLVRPFIFFRHFYPGRFIKLGIYFQQLPCFIRP